MDRSKEKILQDASLKDLLTKYWEGETSLEEEKQIYVYFNQPAIGEDFKIYAPLFAYLQTERELHIDVENEVMGKVEALSQKKNTKVIQLNWRRAVSIAASLLLVFTLSISVYKNQQMKKDIIAMDTFQTPEEALEQTKAALAYLTARMNKGAEKVEESLLKTQTLDIINQ